MGPQNCLVRHGKEGERCFGGERKVTVVTNRDGEEEWRVTPHDGPGKMTMTEKAELVDRQTELTGELKDSLGEELRVLQVTMFPRFVR